MAESKKQPKVIGGINWSTRAKSKTFWVAIVSAIAVFANQVTSAFGVDYSVQIEQGVNIIGSILTFLAMIGVVVDNNTKGVKDSEIVQTDYIQPRDSNNPNHYVQWQNQSNSNKQEQLNDLGIMEPKEFDTSEPFTDDSEDVEFDVSEREKQQGVRGQKELSEENVSTEENNQKEEDNQ